MSIEGQGTYVIFRIKGLQESDVTLEATAGAAHGGAELEPTLETAELDAQELEDVARDPSVLATAPDIPVKLIAPVSIDLGALPTTDSANATWGVESVGAATSPFDGSGVTVGVLDTGIDPNQSAFAGVDLVRRNFTHEDEDDIDGHGTHVAGTIFGRDEDGLRFSVAPGITRAVIGKVLGTGGGGSAQLFQAMQWAIDEGAVVINMSLGVDFPGYVEKWVLSGIPRQAATAMALEGYRDNVRLFDSVIETFKNLATIGAKSALIVAATGNESERVPTPTTPAYTVDVSTPAAAKGIISVGALSPAASADGPFGVAPFSNTSPVVVAPGVGIRSAALGSGTRLDHGTSMASPHVTGVAALWAQRMIAEQGALNLEALGDLVSGQADRTRTPYTQREVGLGIVRAPQA